MLKNKYRRNNRLCIFSKKEKELVYKMRNFGKNYQETSHSEMIQSNYLSPSTCSYAFAAMYLSFHAGGLEVR